MIAIVNQIVAADNPAAVHLVDALKGFVGPILLLIIGVVALRFLFTQQITKFAAFALVAILVGVLFYNPEIIKSIAAAFVTGAGGNTLGQ